MIGAVVALGLTAVLIAGVLAAVIMLHASERREWGEERLALINRIIAQHTGEVLALDRAAKPRPERPDHERPQAVGL